MAKKIKRNKPILPLSAISNPYKYHLDKLKKTFKDKLGKTADEIYREYYISFLLNIHTIEYKFCGPKGIDYQAAFNDLDLHFQLEYSYSQNEAVKETFGELIKLMFHYKEIIKIIEETRNAEQ